MPRMRLQQLLQLQLLLGCCGSGRTALAFFAVPPSTVRSAPSFSPATDAILYNLGRTATPSTGRCGDKACPLVTVNRTLTDRLTERISVLDFGANGDCRGDTEAGCKVDSTAAFNNALEYAGGENSSPEIWQTIYVPPGYYRIDGTITIFAQWLVIQKGARLLRKRFATDNAAPILRVAGTRGRITGGGMLLTENVSPRGVLNIGPPNLTSYENIGQNTVEGLLIAGCGLPECTNVSTGPIICTGVHMDSSEPFVGGSCYQNNVRDVAISGVDVGVYAGKYVNANQLSGIQMGDLGRYGTTWHTHTLHQAHPNPHTNPAPGAPTVAQRLLHVCMAPWLTRRISLCEQHRKLGTCRNSCYAHTSLLRPWCTLWRTPSIIIFIRMHSYYKAVIASMRTRAYL